MSKVKIQCNNTILVLSIIDHLNLAKDKIELVIKI